MSHERSNLCAGCRAADRLKIVDEQEVGLVHSLVRNMMELSRISMAGEQIGFDVLSELVESVCEDVIAEVVSTQLPGSDAIN